MRAIALLPLAGILIASCEPRMLSIQTEYLSHINLASYHVGTPDPLLRNPPLGQKLLISWKVKEWNLDTAYDLSVKIRYRNGTSLYKDFSIRERRGTLVFPLLNEDYFDKGGFKTYMATISANGVVLDEWRHQLWVNIIEISEQDNTTDESEQDEESEESDQESYDEHYKGEGGIQRPIEDITDPNQTLYKYYF